MSKKPRIQIAQLNPHAKGLFLEHCSKNVFKQKEHHSEGNFKDNGIREQLYRILLISKKYLHASRQFKVYKWFIVIHSAAGNSNKLYLTHKDNYNMSGFRYNSFEIELGKFHKMNELLNVPCMMIYVFDENGLNKYCEMFDTFKGKLGLKFDNSASIKFAQKYSTRMNELSLPIEFIIDMDMPSLNLEFCEASEWKDLDELKEILLKHRIKKLKFIFPSFNKLTLFKNSEQEFFHNFPNYPHLNELSLSYVSQTENDQFLDLLRKMLTYFPNLKKFHLQYSHFLNVKEESNNFSNFIMEKIESAKAISKTVPQFNCVYKFVCQVEDYNKVFEETLEPLSQLTGIKQEELRGEWFYDQDDGEFRFWECAEDLKWREGNLHFTLSIEIREVAEQI